MPYGRCIGLKTHSPVLRSAVDYEILNAYVDRRRVFQEHERGGKWCPQCIARLAGLHSAGRHQARRHDCVAVVRTMVATPSAAWRWDSRKHRVLELAQHPPLTTTRSRYSQRAKGTHTCSSWQSCKRTNIVSKLASHPGIKQYSAGAGPYGAYEPTANSITSSVAPTRSSLCIPCAPFLTAIPSAAQLGFHAVQPSVIAEDVY